MFKVKKIRLRFVTFALLFYLVSLYVSSIVYRARALHTHFLQHNRGWIGVVHQADTLLGFKPIPNSRGFHTFPVGEDIPMAYDQNGFRVALSDTLKEDSEIDILFLGCSFTYGDACLAEHTFPYLTAKKLNKTYINAGVCSYGLTQMVLLSEKLIPKYNPKYVVIQHSSWLVERGTSLFAPVYYGSLPNPYFVEREGKMDIHPPIYISQIFGLNPEIIKSQSLLIFFINTGFKFYVIEDARYISLIWEKITHKIDKPTMHLKEAEMFGYKKIIETAEKYGAYPIILHIDSKNKNLSLDEIIKYPNAKVVDTDIELTDYLSHTKSHSFSKEFEHWRIVDHDSVLVDRHPNFASHSIIAHALIQAINHH